MRHYEPEQLIEDALNRIAEMQAELLTLRGIQEERDALRGECGVLRETLETMLASIGSAKCSMGGIDDHYRNHPVSVKNVERWRQSLASSPRSALVGEVLKRAEKWKELWKEAVRINHDEAMPYEAFLHAEQLADVKRDELWKALDALTAREGDRERARED